MPITTGKNIRPSVVLCGGDDDGRLYVATVFFLTAHSHE
jgi:hypothetical protein